MKGLTGVIKFDHEGFRSDFSLDIVELSKDGLRKVGTWNSSEGVNYTRTYGESQKEIVEILQNKTLVVTTILVSLFVSLLELYVLYRVFGAILMYVYVRVYFRVRRTVCERKPAKSSPEMRNSKDTPLISSTKSLKS